MSSTSKTGNEILDEAIRLRQAPTAYRENQVKLKMFFDIALIAIQTVYDAAQNGNVRCIAATNQIETVYQKHEQASRSSSH